MKNLNETALTSQLRGSTLKGIESSPQIRACHDAGLKQVDGVRLEDEATQLMISAQFSQMKWKDRHRFLKSILKGCHGADLAFLHSYVSNSSAYQIDYIDELPEEISIHILSFLPGRSCVMASLVSKRWHRVVHDNDLWRRIVARDATPSTTRKVSREMRLIGKSWRKVFMNDYLTDSNWKSGRYHVSSIKAPDQAETTSLCMSFDDSLETAINVFPNNNGTQGGQLWHVSSGSKQFGIDGHEGSISAVKLSAKVVITGGVDRSVKIWDAKSGVCLHTLLGHEGEIECLQFLDDVLVTGSQDKTIRIWSVSEGVCRGVLLGHAESVSCVQLDSREIASGSTDSTIRIWDIASQTCLRTLQGHTGHIYCLQLDATHIISGSADETIKIWDRTRGVALKTIEGHQSGVVCLQSDGKKIVSGGADQTIKVWSFSSGLCLFTLKKHSGPIWNIKFNKSRLLSSSFDQTVLVWNFDGMDCLSDDERSRWVDDAE